MANPIASLLVRIGADTGPLEAGGRRASKSMEGLGEKAAALGKKLAAVGAAAVAAGAALGVKLVSDAANAAREIDKLSKVANTSTEAFQRNAYAARSMGIESEKLADIYKDVGDKVGDFLTTGGGPLADFFEKIAPRVGVTAEQFRNLSGPQALQLYVDSLERANVSQNEMTFFMEAIASDASMLLPLLKNGGDAMRQMGDEAERLGVVLSQVEVNKLLQAQQEMYRVGEAVKGIGNQIAVALSPYVAEVADRLMDATKNSNGFRSEIQETLETVVRGFGYMADVVRGLQVSLKGVQLVAEGFAAAFYTATEAVLQAVTTVTDLVAHAINAAIRGANQLGASLNEIPLMSESQWAQDFRNFADGSRDRVGRVRQELHELAMQEMPSDQIEAFFNAVRDRANEAAIAAAAVNPAGGMGAPVFDEEAAREQFEKEVALMREQYELRRSLEAELKAVNDAFMQDLERQNMNEILNIRYRGLSEIEKFTADSYKNQAKTISGELADITAGVARENKAMFEINKVAGIANAIIQAYEGISLTLSKYPYPLNIGMAAAHGVAAFAQVNAIKSASFGGGGAAPSLAGGTPATPVTPVTGGTPPEPSGALLTVEGISEDTLFSGRTVRALAERLQEHLRDGGKVQFA